MFVLGCREGEALRAGLAAHFSGRTPHTFVCNFRRNCNRFCRKISRGFWKNRRAASTRIGEFLSRFPAIPSIWLNSKTEFQSKSRIVKSTLPFLDDPRNVCCCWTGLRTTDCRPRGALFVAGVKEVQPPTRAPESESHARTRIPNRIQKAKKYPGHFSSSIAGRRWFAKDFDRLLQSLLQERPAVRRILRRPTGRQRFLPHQPRSATVFTAFQHILRGFTDKKVIPYLCAKNPT